MVLFRKITLKNKYFLWTYSFDDYDYQNDSNLVIKDCERKGKLVIRFQSLSTEHGYCPFNKGLCAFKGSEEVIINLNRPKYIAEILLYILDYCLQDDGFNTTENYDGIRILVELGYTFDYHLDQYSTAL